MARGGKRPGAGRKPGSKDKPIYVPVEGELSPLDYMLEIMRNRALLKEERMAAAKAAAPYCHARLVSKDLNVEGELIIDLVSHLDPPKNPKPRA